MEYLSIVDKVETRKMFKRFIVIYHFGLVFTLFAYKCAIPEFGLKCLIKQLPAFTITFIQLKIYSKLCAI